MPLASYKVLGQVNPASGVQTLLYNTPHYYSTKVSSLVICNYSNSAARFNVIAANTTGAQFHINSNTLISGNDTMIIDNIGLDDNSNVYVTPVNSSSLSFSLFGKEQVKPYEAVTVQYLIIGGGGGGGRQQNYRGQGGGGGAGGLTYGSFSMRKTTDNVLAITVGAGGAGGVDASGSNGANTIISQGSATKSIGYGGGGGGIGDYQYGGAGTIHAGSSGGSGGGGSGSDGTFNGQGGSAIQPSSIYGGLGNSGGAATVKSSGTRAGGYGGGAGGGYTGTLGSRAYGNGISLTTALASFPTTTYSGFFAQGGKDGGNDGAGTQQPGAANTGNGADGGNTFNGNGSNGGSGTAFLWWPQEYPFVELPVITGSYTYIRQNGYSIYRFTDSGSIRF